MHDRSLAGNIILRLVLFLLILAILVVIGLPLTARTRMRNTRETISEELMQLVVAREKYGLEHNQSAGTTITIKQLLADGKYLKELPSTLKGREDKIRLGPIGGRVAYQLNDGSWFDPLPPKDNPIPTPAP